ncbi:MAG: hypothetical protein AB7V43_19560, partial [Acidimicrobiia bacterium]
PLEIFNEGGASIYHMVFATDSDAGNRIMTNLYNAAADEFPEMREQARRRRKRLDQEASGVHNLFGDELDVSIGPVTKGEKLYSHTPPTVPYGTMLDR